MAVTITGSNGLATRIGHLAGCLNEQNSLRGSGVNTTNILAAAGLPTRFAQFQADAVAGAPVLTKLLDGFFSAFVEGTQSAMGTSAATNLQSLAQAILVSQVDADSPLATEDVENALTVLIGQLVSNYNITTSTVAAGAQTTLTGNTNVGTPTIISSVYYPSGLTLEYSLPETITFRVTSDANGGATLNNEPISMTGMAAITDKLNWLWPAGSGETNTLNVTDALSNNSSGNVLYNSGFDTFTTANVPDNWTIQVGTAGTDVLSSSTIYDSTTNPNGKSLEFLGDGSTLTAVTQLFGTTPSATVSAGGTDYELLEKTQYCYSLYYKLSADPAAGVLRIALINGTSGSVLNDDAGNAISTTVSLPGVNDTDWHQVTLVIRTPTNLPDSVKLQLKLTTALSSGVYVLLDHGAMTEMVQFYAPHGPFFAAFSSDTPARTGDAWTVAITTNMAATTWAGVFERFFDIGSLGLRVPTSGGSTINANLIA